MKAAAAAGGGGWGGQGGGVDKKGSVREGMTQSVVSGVG